MPHLFMINARSDVVSLISAERPQDIPVRRSHSRTIPALFLVDVLKLVNNKPDEEDRGSCED